MAELVLRADLVHAMVAHARLDHPIEACGVLAGRYVPERHMPMINAEHSDSRFRFDVHEWHQLWVDLGHCGQRPLVVYHNHPATPAYPSETDLRLAHPEPYHVIISTRDPDADEVRVYRIVWGKVSEIPLIVVPA